MYMLGIWDGHDSGAALLDGDKILYAANEERFTKRKLEVKFPYHSIAASLSYAGVKPSEIGAIAFPTLEFTKTLSRIFPGQKESYYQFRRRKGLRPHFETWMHYQKYLMTSVGPLPLCGAISKASISAELKHMGFGNFTLYPIDHHTAHAATAAFTSGFNSSTVVTLDGLGDGKSGSISRLHKGELEQLSSISAHDSIGIFYEQVTNIIGMRELEDEGKIMAMSDFSYPFPFNQNKLREFFSVESCDIKAKYGPIAQYDMLSRISWSTPREQFAYMAQQVLEEVFVKFSDNVSKEYGNDSLSLSGGIMSNVKANMRVRESGAFKNIHVFPHMGDGGIALGAAMQANYELNGISSYPFSAYLGEEYADDHIEQILKKDKSLHFEYDKGKAKHAAELIDKDNYLFWFQGRMEYGPRALGNRSIIAKADSETVKNKLNLYVKKREWFQPFAPSMLETDAPLLLEDVGKERNKFMTMAYRVKKSKEGLMKSAIHIDLTARPQMVGVENPSYMELLKNVKKNSGYGVILNTSMNIHGMPITMTPEDALKAVKETGTRYLFLGNYFVENKNAVK